MKENYLNIEKGKKFLIVGAGSTIKDYQEKINKRIKEESLIVIGVNNSSCLFVPDYHIWTNSNRLKTFGSTAIHASSKLMFGQGISKKMGSCYGSYIPINYVDKKGTDLKYKNGKIYGYFRTAGCLSLMIAHLFGASRIEVVGMDGYSLKGDKIGESQHCYGKGMTDGTTKEYGKEKDDIVYSVLKNIYNYGIKFTILTPTVFEKFYDSSIL
jgi:hypothetical protein